jgi:hypothetical protein
MTGILFVLTVLLFVIAMTAYGATLVRHKKPISFFDLSALSGQGSRIAGVAYKTWILSIFLAIATGASALLGAF